MARAEAGENKKQPNKWFGGNPCERKKNIKAYILGVFGSKTKFNSYIHNLLYNKKAKFNYIKVIQSFYTDQKPKL